MKTLFLCKQGIRQRILSIHDNYKYHPENQVFAESKFRINDCVYLKLNVLRVSKVKLILKPEY